MKPAIIFIAALLLQSSCGSGIFDRSPAARIGDEIVSRGFLRYTMKKLSADGGEAGAGIRDAIIRDALIACRAREDKLDASEEFKRAYGTIRANTGREFICEMLGVSGNCDDRLYEMIQKEYHASLPAVDWNRVYISDTRPFIPFGGKIPARPDVPAAGRSEEINREYASTVTVASDHVKTTLLDMLLLADDQSYDGLKDGAGREALFRTMIVNLHLTQLRRRLTADQNALLDEINLRAGENLLTEIYRRSIGFVNISGGKASAVTYPVSDREAERYYRENPGRFEEPLSVDLSHIRVKDFAAADKIYRELKGDPSSFCRLAERHSTAADAGASCGRIGVVSRTGGRLPLFMEIGFTMKEPGQVSKPFMTPDGVEILKLNRRVVRVRPYDAYTRQLAIDMLQAVKREDKLRQGIEEMKKKYPVMVY